MHPFHLQKALDALHSGGVGRGVSRTRWRGHPGDPQVAHVARERALGDVPPPFREELAQFFLAGDGARRDDFAYGVLAVLFGG